jgi:iron complex outermembrane receptor protein
MPTVKLIATASFTSAMLIHLVPAYAGNDTAPQVDALEEIVVTATRREEPLQNIPMSVAVVSGVDLTTAGAVDLFNDVGFSSANVVFNMSGSNPFLNNQSAVTIRGISGRAQIYIDDVLLGPGQAAPSQLVDIDHIETLRGPQGTTFGRDTIAGAINIITKKPSFTWTGSVDATAGSFDLHQERGYVSGPLIADMLAFSVSGFQRSNDGIDATVTGKRVNDTRTEGGRASLLFTPADGLNVQLSYDYTRDNPNNIWAWHLVGPNPGALPVASNPANFGKVLDTDFADYTTQDHQGTTLRVDWQLDGVKVTNITAYRSTHAYFFTDQDRTTLDILNADLTTVQHQLTEELRVDGSWRNVRWLGGLFYFENFNRQFSGNFIGPDATFFAPLQVPPELQQITLEDDRLRSTAVYGSANIDITQNLSATVGARYTWDRLASTYAVSGPGAYAGFDPGPPEPALQAPYVYPLIKAGHFDPSASLTYAFDPKVRGYVAVSTGYQAPANNSQQACEGPTALAPCQLKPELVTSYELGLKSEFWDNRAKLNIAAFYMNYRDLQVFQSFLIDNEQVFTNTNAGKVSGRGVEMEFAVRPIQPLTFDGSLGYEHTKYDSFPNAFVVNSVGGAESLDLSGTDLPFAPHWTGAVSAQFQHHLIGQFDGLARLEEQFRSGYVLLSGPASIGRVSDQKNLNLALGVEQSGGGWSIWLRGRNILDERYPNNGDINAYSLASYVTLSDPSIYSVEVGYTF